MSELHKSGGLLGQPVKRRTASERFAHLSDRLAQALPRPVRLEGAEPSDPIAEPDYPPDDEQLTTWYEVVPRFPMARSGYECSAVDEHVALLEGELEELEQQVQELRARVQPRDAVAAEIERIGEQTSAILLAAHDRARETAREAQEQAERCLSDAAANALAITEEANRKRAAMEQETRRLAEERSRLLADMETLAGTLSTVAREASERLPENQG